MFADRGASWAHPCFSWILLLLLYYIILSHPSLFSTCQFQLPTKRASHFQNIFIQYNFFVMLLQLLSETYTHFFSFWNWILIYMTMIFPTPPMEPQHTLHCNLELCLSPPPAPPSSATAAESTTTSTSDHHHPMVNYHHGFPVTDLTELQVHILLKFTF